MSRLPFVPHTASRENTNAYLPFERLHVLAESMLYAMLIVSASPAGNRLPLVPLQPQLLGAEARASVYTHRKSFKS